LSRLALPPLTLKGLALGAIVALAPFALSTALQPTDELEIHVWAGSDGAFSLYEDDGVTEKFRKGERAVTSMTWNEAAHTLAVEAPRGRWPLAPAKRKLTVVLHGLGRAKGVKVDGTDPMSATYGAKADALTVSVGSRPFGAPWTLAVQPE